MYSDIVIIATTAFFLADALTESLHNVNFRVYVVNNDKDLLARLKTAYPRFIFIEQCFLNSGTDEYIHKILQLNHSLHIVIWSASDIAPLAATRFIYAGAESFFSLRDTGDHIEKILGSIAMGKTYCPADVSAVLDSECSPPIIGVPLSNKEIQIMKLFDRSDKNIANELSISVHTVAFHKTNIYKKCGMKRKKEVLGYAVDHGIIPRNGTASKEQ